MSIPRGLSSEEAAAWAKLAHSVIPIEGRKLPVSAPSSTIASSSQITLPKVQKRMARKPAPAVIAAAAPFRPAPLTTQRNTGLDGHWERKLRAGTIAPDVTLDLHGHTLDSAHARLDSGMMQARAMDARVVLLIAGKSRPVDPADRGQRRGAIRAKVLDWLAAGPHDDAIAAIRKAHRRHGGEGALYLVLKRHR